MEKIKNSNICYLQNSYKIKMIQKASKGCKKLTAEYKKKIKLQMKSIKKKIYFIYSLFAMQLAIYDIYNTY